VSNPEIADWARQAWGQVIVDQNRADLLEKLYEWDGRSNPEHPYHHSYTGLYLKYNQR
jgi:hypothetical protein